MKLPQGVISQTSPAQMATINTKCNINTGPLGSLYRYETGRTSVMCCRLPQTPLLLSPSPCRVLTLQCFYVILCSLLHIILPLLVLHSDAHPAGVPHGLPTALFQLLPR